MTAAIVRHPRAVELVERAKLRRKVEHAVSRLIAVLDDLDGDPEAEPWLGAPEASVIVPQWPRCSLDDREDVDEDGGDILDGGNDDRVDGEPSLGAALNHHDQTRWSQGGRQDVELVNEDGGDLDGGEDWAAKPNATGIYGIRECGPMLAKPLTRT